MTDDGVRIQARYFPEIFNVADEKRAREIILTSEGEGADSATRWALETPYLIELDTSPSMRKLAQDYVGSDRFIVASPAQLDALVTAGLRVHAAIAVWV